MKVLIIGNKSMIGKSLTKQFASTCNVKTGGRNNSANFFIDLESTSDAITISEKFDVMIHCAASFGDNQIENAIQNELINSLGALKVGKIAEKVQCKHLIYISTISAYNVPENGYFGSYGLSKQHGQENLAYICQQLGIGFTSLLLSQIYDACGEARKHQSMFYHIIDCAKDNREVNIFGTKDPKRNFLNIDDVVAIVSKVIEQQTYGIFPCVFPKSYRISEIVKTAFKVFGYKSRINFLPEKPDLLTIYIPDNFSLYKKIKFYPSIDLVDGLNLIKENLGKTTERQLHH